MVHLPKKPWDHYRTTHVRTLAWCLFSPSLIRSPYAGHESLPALPPSVYHDWLARLDQQPAPLLDHMSRCKSPRIGLLFEHYWHFFWAAQLGLAIEPPWPAASEKGQWLKNLQVNHPETHQTLGEADFITYRPLSPRREHPHLLHRELAVKFYLGFLASSSAQAEPQKYQWLGPNCIDRLDIKLAQMSEKQLQLLSQAEAQNALPADWQGLPIERQIVLRGQLFYPAHQQGLSVDTSPLSQNHLRGYWYYLEGLLSSLKKHEDVIILEKADWLCTPERQSHAQIIEKKHLTDALRPFLHQRESTGGKVSQEADKRNLAARPLMLSIGRAAPGGRNTSPSNSCQWLESRRAFVVPAHWPDTNAPCFKT